jgi:hypothetical protein
MEIRTRTIVATNYHKICGEGFNPAIFLYRFQRKRPDIFQAAVTKVGGDDDDDTKKVIVLGSYKSIV